VLCECLDEATLERRLASRVKAGDKIDSLDKQARPRDWRQEAVRPVGKLILCSGLKIGLAQASVQVCALVMLNKTQQLGQSIVMYNDLYCKATAILCPRTFLKISTRQPCVKDMWVCGR
jgi:hypothetical protein